MVSTPNYITHNLQKNRFFSIKHATIEQTGGNMHIVIEGQDGTGKDTQTDLLVSYFESQGKKVVRYSESGTNSTDPFVTEIAKLNFGSKQEIDNRTRTLLYIINRYEQWRKLAEPALKNGDIVITTRNWLSTLIYEGYGSGVSKSLITRLHKEIMPAPYFKPDKIVILTLSEKEREARRIAQGERTTQEVFKSQNSTFQKKLNRSYLTVAKKFGIQTMSAAGTPEEVFERLKETFKI